MCSTRGGFFHLANFFNLHQGFFLPSAINSTTLEKKSRDLQRNTFLDPKSRFLNQRNGNSSQKHIFLTNQTCKGTCTGPGVDPPFRRLKPLLQRVWADLEQLSGHFGVHSALGLLSNGLWVTLQCIRSLPWKVWICFERLRATLQCMQVFKSPLAFCNFAVTLQSIWPCLGTCCLKLR